jgi:hypothetical protein
MRKTIAVLALAIGINSIWLAGGVSATVFWKRDKDALWPAEFGAISKGSFQLNDISINGVSASMQGIALPVPLGAALRECTRGSEKASMEVQGDQGYAIAIREKETRVWFGYQCKGVSRIFQTRFGEMASMEAGSWVVRLEGREYECRTFENARAADDWVSVKGLQANGGNEIAGPSARGRYLESNGSVVVLLETRGG